MINFIKKETVLCISAFFALVSMFFVFPDAEYIGYINFRVLGLLFSLMAVVEGLRGLSIFDIAAKELAAKCVNMRSLVFVLTALCFFSSMFITNDVALLTFVPLALSVLKIAGGQKYIIYTIVLQTAAANMGSMLTPMGNPQNLYIADFYSMSMEEFFGTTIPVCGISGILLLIMLLPVKKEPIKPVVKGNGSKINKKILSMYIILGTIAVLSVFNLIHYIVLTAVTFLAVFFFDRDILKRVDWFLLLTFVMFFVFVGNTARITAIRNFLEYIIQGREMIVSAAASQIISNVPAAVMLSSFTDNGRGLLLGVDIGGLGTPIASLASLISYRLYAESHGCDKGKYMLCFLLINFMLLAVLILIVPFLGI